MIINICKFWPITTKFDFLFPFWDSLYPCTSISLLWNNQRQRSLMVDLITIQWFRNDLSHRKVNIQNQNCIQQNLYFLLLQKIDIKYWKRWYDNNPWLCRLCSKSLKALHVLGLTIFYHFVQYSLTNNNLETLMMWLADEDDILIKIGARFWTFWQKLGYSLL